MTQRPTPNTQHPTPDAPTPDAPTPNDAKLAAAIGLFALLLTCVPYLVGYFAAGKNHFLWLGANIDDAANYLSWMRQGASGSLRQYNRFTTDAQPGLFANPLFLLLGLFARVAHLPLVAVYHIARLGFGAGLLALVWKFLALLLPLKKEGNREEGNRKQKTENRKQKDEKNPAADTLPPTPFPFPRRARLLAFLFVCFASGLGWIPLAWENFSSRATCPAGPIDLWQPEAITFLSLYLNPLFLCAMCLQIGIFMLLLNAERGGGIKSAIFAGICGLVLALVHTYDVLTVAAVWFVYLIIRLFFGKRNPSAPLSARLIPAFIAGIITLPGVLLMASQLQTNKVFNARANVETLTAYPQYLLLGYGLTLLLALYAAFIQSKAQSPSPRIPDFLFLSLWAVVNIAVAYTPGIAFQRKLLQGAHFPLAILAGAGAALLIAKHQPNTDAKHQPNTDLKRFAFAAALLTALLSLTNLKFLLDETERFQEHETKIFIARTNLLPGEVEALQWIAANTPAGAAVQPIPWQTIDLQARKRGISDMTLALFTPALADRAVYCGHFGETPDFVRRLNQDLGSVALGSLPDAQRIAILRRMNVQYLIFSQKDPQDAPADELFPQFRQRSPLPPYLHLVHSNPDADIYQIILP